MPKDLEEEKIKNKKELEEYLLKSLESKKVDTSNSDVVKFVTDYLEELNNFYEKKENEQKLIEDFLLKILFEKKYINYKERFNKYELDFIKNMLKLTNLAKHNNNNNTALQFTVLLMNDINENINERKNDLKLKCYSNSLQSLKWEKEIEVNEKYFNDLKEITNDLIKNGADINIKNNCGNSALELANPSIKKILNENLIQQINSDKNQPSASGYKPNSPKM